jgi:hypothetical protein
MSTDGGKHGPKAHDDRNYGPYVWLPYIRD